MPRDRIVLSVLYLLTPGGILMHAAVCRHGLKIWGGGYTPSTSARSGILIHPAVWPHRHAPQSGGGAVPLFRGAVYPYLTLSPGPVGRGLLPCQRCICVHVAYTY